MYLEDQLCPGTPLIGKFTHWPWDKVKLLSMMVCEAAFSPIFQVNSHAPYMELLSSLGTFSIPSHENNNSISDSLSERLASLGRSIFPLNFSE